jgi:hypothetical protein
MEVRRRDVGTPPQDRLHHLEQEAGATCQIAAVGIVAPFRVVHRKSAEISAL